MSSAWHEIRDHLMQSSSNLHFQRSFEMLRCRHPVIRRFADPAALFDALHHGGDNADRKNIMLTVLIRAAQSDQPESDCALTLMLLALWPGLDAVQRRVRWYRISNPDELPSEILARATEAIRCLDLGRVNRIAATILRNIERDLLRAHQRECDRQKLRSHADPDEIAANNHPTSPAHLHRDLAHIIGADAALVIKVAVEGFSQAEAATRFALSEAAARKRYQRARQRLRSAFEEFA